MEFYRTAAVVNRAIDACFVSHSLVPHGDNPFGQVKPKGSITLRGAMIAVQLRLQQKVQPQENSVEHAGKIMGNCAFPDIGDRVDGRTFWFLKMGLGLLKEWVRGMSIRTLQDLWKNQRCERCRLYEMIVALASDSVSYRCRAPTCVKYGG